MNPHAAQRISPVFLVKNHLRNRGLIWQMIKREIFGRYKGSIIGLLWSFLNPLLMLFVYTFVFSVVFKAKWGGVDEPKSQFAIVLFVGMIVHAFFADILNRSPSLIVANANYVKKVVFPLETLVAIITGSALFHALASVFVLLAVSMILNGQVPWSIVFLPIIFVPLIILAMGFGWIFSALGVFSRDLSQVIGLLTTVLQFLSPVFFPLSSLPPDLRPWIMLNPLTFIIEQARAVLIWGVMPDWSGLFFYMVGVCLFAWLGFAWFQKTRKGFADVL